VSIYKLKLEFSRLFRAL